MVMPLNGANSASRAIFLTTNHTVYANVITMQSSFWCRQALISGPCDFELRRIGSIRSLLTTEATATLVSAFILSRLDYCNALLSGCPRSLILRLQKVQNNAARLILRISKREHISPHLASLHWLPIDSRIKYKLACICYNSLSTNSPPYLSDLLTVYTASRQLRSCSDNSVLRRPSVRTVFYGQRSFAYSAPSAWNALPQQVLSMHT